MEVLKKRSRKHVAGAITLNEKSSKRYQLQSTVIEEVTPHIDELVN